MKLLSILALAPLSFGVAADESIGAKVDALIPSITKECEGYARILTDVKWEIVTAKAKSKGVELTNDYKSSLNRMNVAECILVESISVLEGFKRVRLPMEWSRLGGDRVLRDLHSKLKIVVENTL